MVVRWGKDVSNIISAEFGKFAIQWPTSRNNIKIYFKWLFSWIVIIVKNNIVKLDAMLLEIQYTRCRP